MDPNENAKEQLRIAAALIDLDTTQMSDVDKHNALRDGMRLAELVVALDEWMQKGGFLPVIWRD